MMSHRAPERQPVSPLLILAGLAAVVVLAYVGSLENGFTFDDQGIIVQNPLIKRVKHLPTLLTSDYWAGSRDPEVAPNIHTGLYRPLVLLSFALNYAAAGLTPWTYHAVNVLLHLVVTCLLYMFALQLALSRRAALVGAVLFALHPIHTEVVAGVIGRAELLMAAGVLASLRWGIQGRLGLSLTAFSLALLSKEQAVMLPFLLVLYDLLFGGQIQGHQTRSGKIRQALVRYGPYVLLLLGYVVLRRVILEDLRPPPAPFLDNPLPYLEGTVRVLTTLKVAGRYLWLFLWPRSLSADYSYNAIPAVDSVWDKEFLFAVLAWSSLLTLGIWAWRRLPTASFAIGLLLLTFLPVSNLIISIGTIMGERLFYLPSAGLCLLAGLGYDAVMHRLAKETGAKWTFRGAARPALLLFFLLICGALTARTITRNIDWRGDEHLAPSRVAVTPTNAKAHAGLGRVARLAGHWDEAVDHYQTALSIYPEYANIDPIFNSGLGIALVEKGLIAEGILALERAVSLDPSWSLLWYNLGFAYSKQGFYREAEAAYREAARLNDEDPKAHTGLGFLFLKEHRYEDALSSAEAALSRDPSYVEARYVKAQALEALGGVGANQCPPGLRRC